MRCLLCGKTDDYIKELINFGKVPLAGSYQTSLDQKIEKYPLSLNICTNCYSIQVSHIIDQDLLFRDYRYLSSVTKTLCNHFEEYALFISEKFKNANFIIEIGCNDGILLDILQSKYKYNTLGIEPSINIKKFLIQKKINHMTNFFTSKLSNKIIDDYGKCDIVTCSNVFAHIENIQDVVIGIKNILNDDGVFICEVHHGINVIKDLQYDFIYHEHIFYHSLYSLKKFLDSYGLFVYDVEKIKMHGGSLRIFSSKKKRKIEKNVDMIIDEELKYIKDVDMLKNIFSKKIYEHKMKMKYILHDLKKSGKRVIAYGMSGRASTLLNYWDVGIYIYCGVDCSVERYGRYMSGVDIFIHNSNTFEYNKNDVVLITAWTYRNEILEKENINFEKNNITVLSPLPEIEFLRKGICDIDKYSGLKINKSIILLGSTGTLGKIVLKELDKLNNLLSIKCYMRNEIDFANFDETKFDQILNPGDIVINCVGILDENSPLLEKVNTITPLKIGDICHDKKCFFIHISTNAVFNLQKDQYVNEHDNPNTTTKYGISKMKGEPKNAFVIRTSFFGEENNRGLLYKLKNHKKNTLLNIDINSLWNGVSCNILAKFIVNNILDHNMSYGIRHVFSEEIITKGELISILCKIYNIDIDLNLVENKNENQCKTVCLSDKINLIKTPIEKQIYEEMLYNKS